MSNFGDLINIDDFGKKKDIFISTRWDVAFYCKNCQKIVETERVNPKWYLFKCKECASKDISIGTFQWLKENYRIK